MQPFIQKTRHLPIWIMLSAAYPGLAMASSFLLNGSEVKNNAGAGILNATDSSSVLYNPANLTFTKSGVRTDVELSLLGIDYSYQYPGYDVTKVSLFTPIYSLGMSAQFGKFFSIATTAQVIPESAGKMSITGLPVRQGSPEPIVVDAESKPVGLGYLGGLSLVGRPMDNLKIGTSFIYERTGNVTTATDPDSGAILQEKEIVKKTLRILIGSTLKLFKNRLELGAVYKPAANQSNDVKEKSAASTEWSQSSVKGKEYSLIGVATKVNYNGASAFVEVQREDHTVEAKNQTVEREVYLCTSYAGGVSYARTVHSPRIGLAAGYYPAFVGDGIIADYANQEGPLDGVKFEDVQGGVNRTVVAGSYAQRFGSEYLTGGASYHFGSRSVPEYAPGYGDYKLQVVFITFGYQHQF